MKLDYPDSKIKENTKKKKKTLQTNVSQELRCEHSQFFKETGLRYTLDGPRATRNNIKDIAKIQILLSICIPYTTVCL